MKIKCEYCGAFINDTDERCPNCGAVNGHLKRGAEEAPKTIEELKEFAKKHNLPLEDMRFFLGEDYKQPKAFGIFRNREGEFVVYKNKADGSRSIRYQGRDEEYAVNELYQKMRSEVLSQKQRIAASKGTKSTESPEGGNGSDGNLGCVISFAIVAVIMAAITFWIFHSVMNEPDRGYYRYEDSYYYYGGGEWYGYSDTTDSWSPTSVDSTLSDNYGNYYDSTDYKSDYRIDRFEDSAYYEDTFSSSDWDSDMDWDSGDSWDSDSTDWDSDW